MDAGRKAAYDASPLLAACFRGDEAAARQLVGGQLGGAEAAASGDGKEPGGWTAQPGGWTALHACAEGSCWDKAANLTSLLVRDAGMSVDGASDDGRTPLHMAA